MEFSESSPFLLLKREANESGCLPQSFFAELASLPSSSRSSSFLRHLVEKEVKEAQDWLHLFFGGASGGSGWNDAAICTPFRDKNNRAFCEAAVNRKLLFSSSAPFSLIIGPPRWHQKSIPHRGSLTTAAEIFQKELIEENRGDEFTCATGMVHSAAASSTMSASTPRTFISRRSKNTTKTRKDDDESTASDSFSSVFHRFSPHSFRNDNGAADVLPRTHLRFSHSHFSPSSAVEEEAEDGNEDEGYFSMTIRLSRPFISFSLLQAGESAACSISAEKERNTDAEACGRTTHTNHKYCSIYDKSNFSVPSQRHFRLLSSFIHTFPCAEVTCYVEVHLTTSYLQGHSSHCNWWCGEDFLESASTFSCCSDGEEREDDVHARTFHGCHHAERELEKNIAQKEAASSFYSSHRQLNPVSPSKRFCTSSFTPSHCFVCEDNNDRRGNPDAGEQQKKAREKKHFEKKGRKKSEGEGTVKGSSRPLIVHPPRFPVVFAARGGIMEGCEDFSITMRDDATMASSRRNTLLHPIGDPNTLPLPSLPSSRPSTWILAPHAVERLLASVRRSRGRRSLRENEWCTPLREDTLFSSEPHKGNKGPPSRHFIPCDGQSPSTSSSPFPLFSSSFLRELVLLVDSWLRMELDDQDIKGGPGAVSHSTGLSPFPPFTPSFLSFPYSRVREEMFPTLSSSSLSSSIPLHASSTSHRYTSAADDRRFPFSCRKTKDSPPCALLRFYDPSSVSVAPASEGPSPPVKKPRLLQEEEGIMEREGKARKQQSEVGVFSATTPQWSIFPTFFIRPYGAIFLPHGGVLRWGRTPACMRKKEMELAQLSQTREKSGNRRETPWTTKTAEDFLHPERQEKRDHEETKTNSASAVAMAVLSIDKEPSSSVSPFSSEARVSAMVPPSPFPSVSSFLPVHEHHFRAVSSSSSLAVHKWTSPIYFRTIVSLDSRRPLPSLLWPNAILSWSAADAAFFSNRRGVYKKKKKKKSIVQQDMKERESQKWIQKERRKNEGRRGRECVDGCEKKKDLHSFSGDRSDEEVGRRREKWHIAHRAGYYYSFFLTLLHRRASWRALDVSSIFFSSFSSTSAAAASAVTWLYHVRLYDGGNIAQTLRYTAIHYCRALELLEEEHMILALSTLAESTSSSFAIPDSSSSPSIEVLLWPALEETMHVLQSRRLSLLAGVILCNVILPFVLREPVCHRENVVAPSNSIFTESETDPMECVRKSLRASVQKNVDEKQRVHRGTKKEQQEMNYTTDQQPVLLSMRRAPPFFTEKPILSPPSVLSFSQPVLALPPFTNWCTCYLAVSFLERVLKVLAEWFSQHTCHSGHLSPLMVASLGRISTMKGEARIVRRALEMSAMQVYFSSSCHSYDWKHPWIPFSSDGLCFLKQRREPMPMFNSCSRQGAPTWMRKGWQKAICDPVSEFEPHITNRTREERRNTMMKDSMEEEGQQKKRISDVTLSFTKKNTIHPSKKDVVTIPDINSSFPLLTSSFHELPSLHTCAICGESIFSDEKRGTLDKRVEHALEAFKGSSEGPQRIVSVRKGSLILQCTRCGHGGHVDHVFNWWKHSPVQQCPQGCGCHCSY